MQINHHNLHDIFVIEYHELLFLASIDDNNNKMPTIRQTATTSQKKRFYFSSKNCCKNDHDNRKFIKVQHYFLRIFFFSFLLKTLTI